MQHVEIELVVNAEQLIALLLLAAPKTSLLTKKYLFKNAYNKKKISLL